MKCVVLAAGLGKRMHPLSLDRPKHLLPIVGRPLIGRVVEAVAETGITELGVVVGYRAELIEKALGDMRGVRIDFIKQEQQLGTAHALLSASGFLSGEERFAVVYGDVTLDASELSGLIRESVRGFDGGLIGVETWEAARFGVIEERGGILSRVWEKPMETRGIALVNAGVYVLPAEVLEYSRRLSPSPRGEYELTDALNLLAEAGRRLLVKRGDAKHWLDVGRPGDLLRANLIYLERLAGSHGTGPDNPPSYIGDARIGSDVEITRSVVLDGAWISDGAHVENSLVMEGAEIGQGCKLSYCVIGENARIGVGSLLMGSGKAPIVVGHRESVPPWSRVTGSA